MDEYPQFYSTLKNYVVIWVSLTVMCIFTAIFTQLHTFVFLLISASLSLCGCVSLFISGILATPQHREKYSLVYCLITCSFFFTLKMFLSSLVVISSHRFQERHAVWCYMMALLGHAAMIGSIGYSFVMILDTAICKTSSHRVLYHICIWIIAITTCIPALVAGAIGVNDHGICYFTNQYEIIPGVITTLFHVYCIGFIAYIFRHYIAHGRLGNICTTSTAYKSLLIFISVFCAFVWNAIYYMTRNVTDKSPPHWLHSVQLFWLGGVGLSNALVWYPFTKHVMMQVRVRNPRLQRVPSGQTPIPIESTSQQSEVVSRVDYTDSNGVRMELPVYRIPKRWQQETVNSCI